MAVYVYVFLLSAPKPTLTAAFTQYTGVFAAYSHIAGSRRRSANCFNCIRFLVSRGYLCCTVIDIRCFQAGSHTHTHTHTHTQTFELMLTLLFSTHASLYLFFRILIKSKVVTANNRLLCYVRLVIAIPSVCLSSVCKGGALYSKC